MFWKMIKFFVLLPFALYIALFIFAGGIVSLLFVGLIFDAAIKYLPYIIGLFFLAFLLFFFIKFFVDKKRARKKYPY
jgi:hypothetical protein